MPALSLGTLQVIALLTAHLMSHRLHGSKHRHPIRGQSPTFVTSTISSPGPSFDHRRNCCRLFAVRDSLDLR